MNPNQKTTTEIDAEANVRAEERRAYERDRLARAENLAPAVVQITAEEAAVRIRRSGLLDDAHPMTPEDRHRANFAGRVCAELGLDPTVENFARVEAAMKELDIVPHEGHEYPKMVKTGRKVQCYDTETGEMVDTREDEEVIVNDADEEAEATAGNAPEPQPEQERAPPEPRRTIPDRGIRPTEPGVAATADAPAGFRDAGAGRLHGAATEAAPPPPPPSSPRAPQRRA